MKLLFPDSITKAWREIVDEEEFIQINNRIVNNEIKGLKRATLGSYVITVETRYNRKRYINHDATMEYEGKLYAYSEIAKAILWTLREIGYIRKRKKNILFGFTKEHMEILEESIPAIYAKAGEYRGMVYLDIKAFYFTIYRRFLQCDYRRGKVLGVGDPLPEEVSEYLQNNKRLRNVLFGIMRNRKISVWTQGTIKIVNAGSIYFNPQLAILTYDISQAIAKWLIEECQAVYYYVDGFIIPEKYEDKAKKFLSELGFRVEEKARGEYCIVKSAGCYAFLNEYGEFTYETRHFTRRERYTSTSNLYLSDEEQAFLLDRLRRFINT